jgi:hypothetical protein
VEFWSAFPLREFSPIEGEEAVCELVERADPDLTWWAA